MTDLIKCPVKGCHGYYSSSKELKLIEHIKRMSMRELLDRELGFCKRISHATFIKNNIDTKRTELARRYRNTAIVLKQL